MNHPAVTLMVKNPIPTWKQVREGIGACNWCTKICHRKAQPVQGARPVLFVGESPSRLGATLNDVFRGTCATVMDSWRGLVSMTNAIACLSYPPSPEHEQACRPWLHATVLALQPKAVFAFGKVAERNLTKLRSKWQSPNWDLWVFKHPCFMVRFADKLRVREYVQGIWLTLAPYISQVAREV